ncbi:MAG: glutamine-hydrolyzing carbamoyl-phosphate synthase small subunit [Planctomycetota bacterium]
MSKALLTLEDGFTLEGRSFGASGERLGEVVFNTSMTGYQEVLTDPSYCRQIVAMTYPLIGNYGTNSEDVESARPQVEGFVVREVSRIPSNWRSQTDLPTYLKKNNVIGIDGVDTRALVRHIRTQGAMKGILSTEDLDPQSLQRKAQEWPGLVGRDTVECVTCKSEYKWEKNSGVEKRFDVVVYDYGVKFNILRMLERAGCRVTVLPATTKAEDVLARDPDGVVLSNGPGDPAAVVYAIEEIRKLLGKKPIFGICLGHQLLGLAFGGKTYKLKFGHRGGNQPVKDLRSGRVAITAQNHGFCVDIDSLKDQRVEITHINLNDQTLEGMRHKEMPVFSVQYHPEASPGPHDAEYLFKEFTEAMTREKSRGNG